MYADPRFIRNKRVNLSLNPAEQRLIEAAAEVAGKQPSAYVRELLISALTRHESEFAPEAKELRRANQ